MTTHKEIYNLLRRMDAFLKDESRWIKDSYLGIRFIGDESVEYTKSIKKADCGCLTGVAHIVCGYGIGTIKDEELPVYKPLIESVKKYDPIHCKISRFNDHPSTTFKDIKAVLKMAINKERRLANAEKSS